MGDPVPEALSPALSPRLTWSSASRLIRLQNQTGTLLLLMPTLWTLVLAERGIPPWHLVLIFALGSFLMRSAGVVLNDLADRGFDRQVTRTLTRPLASGELTAIHALIILIILLSLAALLVFQLNWLTMIVSPIALCLAMLYPFAKRIIHIPQAMLGIAFGWGTIMAWTASRGSIEITAWLIFAATICWAIAYDTIYALQDMDDDRRIGVKSSALFFGPYTWLAVGISLGLMLTLLAIAGWIADIGWIFYGSLLIGAIFVVKQLQELRRSIQPERAFRMFDEHVWLGGLILAGLVAGFLF